MIKALFCMIALLSVGFASIHFSTVVSLASLSDSFFLPHSSVPSRVGETSGSCRRLLPTLHFSDIPADPFLPKKSVSFARPQKPFQT
jgi:hypothetical protein